MTFKHISRRYSEWSKAAACVTRVCRLDTAGSIIFQFEFFAGCLFPLHMNSSMSFIGN